MPGRVPQPLDGGPLCLLGSGDTRDVVGARGGRAGWGLEPPSTRQRGRVRGSQADGGGKRGFPSPFAGRGACARSRGANCPSWGAFPRGESGAGVPLAPLCCVCRAGMSSRGGWMSLSLCPHPAGPSLPSAPQFTGCEPQLGEETGLNLRHGLGVSWGSTGSLCSLSLPGAHVSPVGSNRAAWVAVPGAQPVPVGLGMLSASPPPLPPCLGLDHGGQAESLGEGKGEWVL